MDAQIPGVSAAGARPFRTGQDRAQQTVGRVAPHEESGDADGGAEKYLSTFALDKWFIGYVGMRVFPRRLILKRERGDQGLYIDRPPEVIRQAFKQAVVTTLEPGESHLIELTQPIK